MNDLYVVWRKVIKTTRAVADQGSALPDSLNAPLTKSFFPAEDVTFRELPQLKSGNTQIRLLANF